MITFGMAALASAWLASCSRGPMPIEPIRLSDRPQAPDHLLLPPADPRLVRELEALARDRHGHRPALETIIVLWPSPDAAIGRPSPSCAPRRVRPATAPFITMPDAG